MADYAEFGREQLGSMHVPPSPMLRSGLLGLSTLVGAPISASVAHFTAKAFQQLKC